MQVIKPSSLSVLICLALILFSASACIKHPPRNAGEPELEANISESNPKGLNFEVEDLNWTYYNDKAMIRVTGKARNMTGQTQQAVTLHGIVFDEKGSGVLSGRSFLNPTYLPDGEVAEFEFVGLVQPGMKNIKFIKLVTSATVLR